VTSVKLTSLGFGKLLKQVGPINPAPSPSRGANPWREPRTPTPNHSPHPAPNPHQVDEKIAAKATQLVRPLTNKFVENHLNDVGLEPEFASHSRIGALSGGQKVKVVLAAAMWNTPHIIILDEPTNYLDRDSLGAMAEAINLYEGGVVIISHNAQFVDQVCPEVWHLENHTLNLKGSYDWLESANKEAAKVAKQADTYIDGQGNEVEIAKARKKASKSELKKIKKEIAAKRKGGQECYTDEELELAGFLPDV
jgi:elongation factor 3